MRKKPQDGPQHPGPICSEDDTSSGTRRGLAPNQYLGTPSLSDASFGIPQEPEVYCTCVISRDADGKSIPLSKLPHELRSQILGYLVRDQDSIGEGGGADMSMNLFVVGKGVMGIVCSSPTVEQTGSRDCLSVVCDDRSRKDRTEQWKTQNMIV